MESSIADTDPGSGAFFSPGSGIGFYRIPDLGSPTHISESLGTIFWVKELKILCQLAKFFSIPVHCVQKSNNFNFVKFVATKKVRQQIFPPSSVVVVVGSGIREG
jgi:hypothetical protein